MAWKRDVFVAEVNKNCTSQQCPSCVCHTGKNTLDVRKYIYPECGYPVSSEPAVAESVLDGINQLSSVEKPKN